MANKKATAKKVEVAPQEVVETIVQPKKILKVEMPKMAEPKWEYKARTYYLKTGKSPLVYTIPSRHSQKKPLLYFDEEKGYQRELRYATNHASPFVDEQKGPATLGRIVLRDGLITVNKEDVCLQKLLFSPTLSHTLHTCWKQNGFHQKKYSSLNFFFCSSCMKCVVFM